MKLVYMGTPEFAVGPLEALLSAGHEVCAAVTQPDRPKGRGGRVQISPVKACALAHNIPVLQPAKIRMPESVEALRALGADVFVVAAFGQILSQELLDLPAYGCLNIHASLLPGYRGAAPIEWAILNGESRTGVTIMRMDAGIDTGDMLLKREVPIAEDDTDESLRRKLSEAGSGLIVEALEGLQAGTLRAEKQNDAQSSYVGMLTRSMGRIDWEEGALQIERKVRGLYSWPGAYTFYQGKQLKLLQAKAVRMPELAAADGASAGRAPEGGPAPEPGTVVQAGRDVLLVGTGDGVLRISEVQLEGKKRMSVRDFLNGCRVKEGDRLG